MWWQALLMQLVKALPLERLVAWMFSRLLGKYIKDPNDVKNYDKAINITSRVMQQCMVVMSALEDREITEDEVTTAAQAIMKHWAKGKAKTSESGALEEAALRTD